MFTGLVETMGHVLSFRRTGNVYTLEVGVDNKAANFASELVLGQSVAVSGACLTVTSVNTRANAFSVEMMPETVTRTWFGRVGLNAGRRVNLERALRIGDRLDGHLVLGHVDGIAVLKDLSGSEQTRVAVFEIAGDKSEAGALLRGIVSKGSVALDGVSLTVINVTSSTFSVGLIPTTLTNCTLGALKVGDAVNIETDILGKYVERLLTGTTNITSMTGAKNGSGLTMEDLVNLGY